jgi:SAM-dependent methyltransferase
VMELNPPSQYADGRNLDARQRLWRCQVPAFDLAGWVLDLTRVAAGVRVLDAGCGNGLYLRRLREREALAVGADLSMGMLRGGGHRTSVNTDVVALPFAEGAFDVVLAGHVLDLVPRRAAAIAELRRVLRKGGACLVVATGARHLQSLRDLIESAARVTTPGWRMHPPTGFGFTAENAAAQLGEAFAEVICVRPDAGQVLIRDGSVAADYVMSLADHYQPEVARPWPAVAEEVREKVQEAITAVGGFSASGDLAAFVCR